MDFPAKALVALSSDASRITTFGQNGLKNVVKASYGLEDAVIQGAATPTFSAFTLGGLDPDDSEGASELPAPALRIDALWRGSIRLSASFPKSEVLSVQAGGLSLAGLDDDVAAANGGVLPSDDALEAARRTELRNRLDALVDHTEAATDDVIDAWLASAGATSVGQLLEADDTVPLSELKIRFSPPLGGGAFTQMDFPVAVSVAIRDPNSPGSGLVEIISGVRRLQSSLRRAGFEPKNASEAGGHGRAVIALLVPDDWFDDTDWPGANKADRINQASAWMAQEGIALVPAAL